MRKPLIWVVILALPTFSTYSHGNEDFHPLAPWTYPGHWQHTTSVQSDWFAEDGLSEQSDNNLSLAYEGSYSQRLNNTRAQLQIQPFARLDQHDDQRTHWDFREFSLTYLGQGWTLRGGMAQVTWGASTLYSIVDVINQRDFIEGDHKAKLGQPLLEYTQTNDLGTLSLYALPGFRTATFPGEQGRPRTPIYIDSDSSVTDDTQQAPFDYAVRWQHHIDNFHFALSYFNGLSRIPRFEFNFDFNHPKIIPVYETVEQLGLEMQWLHGNWAFNFEAISRQGDAPQYQQYKTGIEHQWINVFNSQFDILTSLDYIKESKNKYSTNFLDNDYIAGLQLRFNDVYNSWFGLALIYDPDTKEQATNLNFNRAINDQWDYNISVFFVKENAPTEEDFLSRERLDQIVSDVLSGDLSSYQALQRQLLELLDNNPYITTENEYLQRFIGDALVNNALATLDIDSSINTLNQLYVMGNVNHRLNLLGNDDFIRFELNYHF